MTVHKLTLSEGVRYPTRSSGGRVTVAPELVARFWDLVDTSGECWLWAGTRDRNGYGRVPLGKHNGYAHRLSLAIAHGDFDPAMDVCHKCDNPPCVRPDHLFLGTHQDNLRDAGRKGRLGKAIGEGHGQAKLTWTKVDEIRRLHAAGKASHRELAERFGVSQVAIHFVVTGKTWTKRPAEEAEDAA